MNELPVPLWGDIQLDKDGKLYYIFRFDSCDERESWDEYVDARDMLLGLGYTLIDPYTEHDCVSGNLKEVSK